MDTRKDIISIRSLEIGYSRGKRKNILLPPISASAGRGELIALIGKNGIGKSTLLRTLTGLHASLEGDITYSGRSISGYTRMELARLVGFISTEAVRINNMTVYDLIALGRFPHTNWIGKVEEKDHQSIHKAMEQTSLTTFSNRLITELSDGERQKAMIARLLAQDTDIMIMDEPTAFLDVAGRYDILHLLHSLTEMQGKTIIYSTHDLQMAVNQSDKIWLLLEDRLIEGAPEDLMISGAFANLFKSASVQYNNTDGTFSFNNEIKSKIFIDGDGVMKHWTEKALNRAGYDVSNGMTSPYIIVPSVAKAPWQLVTASEVIEINSVYELIKTLNHLDS